MYLSPLQLSSNSQIFLSGDVVVNEGAAIAPGAILQADPGSRLSIAAGACIGMGVILHAREGTLEIAAGAILGPMDSWLILRGTKTLTVRMEKTNSNAQVIADFLAGHEKVQRTIYPGLTSHPHHALAKRQMRGFGGLISFDVGSLAAAKAVLNNLKLMALAESLGGVETLISHPAIMTHASVPQERRAMLGITDGLIRISVGIEDVEDLQADLAQALAST